MRKTARDRYTQPTQCKLGGLPSNLADSAWSNGNQDPELQKCWVQRAPGFPCLGQLEGTGKSLREACQGMWECRDSTSDSDDLSTLSGTPPRNRVTNAVSCPAYFSVNFIHGVLSFTTRRTVGSLVFYMPHSRGPFGGRRGLRGNNGSSPRLSEGWRRGRSVRDGNGSINRRNTQGRRKATENKNQKKNKQKSSDWIQGQNSVTW